MLKNSLFQPSLFSTLSLFQPSFSFSFSAAHFFFFSVSWLAAPFSSPLFFQPSFSFLQVSCPLFLSPNVFQLKNTFFSPKLFSVQPKTFFFFFQFSHSSLLLFSALFFSGSTLSFFFQRLIFFFSLAPFIQDPMFSLAVSHLFYLNKSLFSSNLE